MKSLHMSVDQSPPGKAMQDLWQEAMLRALAEAKKYLGATTPNPPVGAVGLSKNGQILAAAAHQKAGQAHAEINLFHQLRTEGKLAELHTLVTTLEPCDHFGKTPPCTLEITHLKNICRVVVGVRDPHYKVNGKGIERLRAANIEVIEGVLENECRDLITPFAHRVRTGRPWVTLKIALNRQGSMKPPKDQKTFTSEASLLLAHRLRKRADATLTGSGTVLADNPLFSVRKTSDHQDKKRYLVLMDRRGRVANSWIKKASNRGFKPITGMELEAALDYLGKQGVSEVLIEAGPTLTQSIIDKGLWNNQLIIHQAVTDSEPDRVEIKGPKGVMECLPE